MPTQQETKTRIGKNLTQKMYDELKAYEFKNKSNLSK